MSSPAKGAVRLRIAHERPKLRRIVMLGPTGAEESTGLYQFVGETDRFWARPRLNGKQKKVLLRARTQKDALKELGRIEDGIEKFENGLAPNPFVKSEKASLAEIVNLFIAKGCPGKKRGTGGAASTQRDELKNAKKFLDWSAAKDAANSFGPEIRESYARWRVRSIRAGKSGDRQIDKELGTLSAVFRIAIKFTKQTGITENPLIEREHYCKAAAVVHCRDRAPENGDQLHALARFLFQSRRSEVLGWQLLVESFVGQRSHEIVRLRLDAAPRQPGYIDEKERVLWLYDSESSKGTFQFCELDHIRTRDKRIATPLGECLAALRTWHKERFGERSGVSVPWYFPSPDNPSQPVGSTALTHALRRIAPLLNQPHRTSHGLRSFFVNVLRTHRVPDTEVALRIGQKTAGKLIVNTYGKIPAGLLSWLPSESRPAWSHFSGDDSDAVYAEQLDLNLI